MLGDPACRGRGAGRALRQHHRGRFQRRDHRSGRLVGAGAGADVQDPAGIAERGADLGFDPGIRTPGRRVGRADRVVARAHRPRTLGRTRPGDVGDLPRRCGHRASSDGFQARGRVRARITAVKIGVLGATGPAGKGLAARLADVGPRGAGRIAGAGQGRDRRGRAAASGGATGWRTSPPRTTRRPATPRSSCSRCTPTPRWPPPSTSPTTLDGKIVVSMANHLVRNGTEFNAVLPPHGSLAKEMQALLWRSQIVTAFHLVPAAELAELDHKMESDVVACGDDDDARATLMNDHREHPGPARVRRWLARERGRHGDVRRGAADDQHPPQGASRAPAQRDLSCR